MAASPGRATPGCAQWPLLFTSYSKVNTPARTQHDCWGNSFLLSWKCVCVSVCAGSVYARAEACVANSKPPFDRTVCVCQLFPLKVRSSRKKMPAVHTLRLELVADPGDICAQVHLSLHAHSVEAHSLPKRGSYGTGDGARSKVPVVQTVLSLCECAHNLSLTVSPTQGPFFSFFYSPSKALFAAMWFIPWNGMVFSRNCHTLGWETLRKLEIVSRHFYGFRSVNIMITVRMNGCKLDPVFLPWPRPDIQAP